MFTKNIRELKLTNRIANTMFPNIFGSGYSGDNSFLATLRALLYNRIPEGESIQLSVTSSSFDERRAKEGVIPYVCEMIGLNAGFINIHDVRGFDDKVNTATFDTIDDEFVTLLDGFEPIDILTKYFEQKKYRARFYLNAEKRAVHIFIERLDIRKWHFLQGFIPRYFPMYFEDNPLNEAECKLLKSLTNRYSPDYEKCIEELANRFDFRTAEVKEALGDFEVQFEKEDLKRVKREITQHEREIKDLEQSFSAYYRVIEDLKIRKIGLETKINGERDGESPFLEYFLADKSLHLVSASQGQLDFIVKTVIASYDPDLFDRYFKKSNNPFLGDYHNYYKNYDCTDFTREQIEKLVKAIFKDEIMKLKVCAAYRLNFVTGEYSARGGYDYPAEILAEYIPNMHIHKYSCLGNNAPHIRDAITRRDYAAAVAACSASAINMNMAEPHTVSYFMREVLSPEAGRIILMPDGTSVTPIEAVTWLEEKETAKVEE